MESWHVIEIDDDELKHVQIEDVAEGDDENADVYITLSQEAESASEA